MVKTVVIESAGVKLAYVIFDLVSLIREDMTGPVRRASLATGIPVEHIIWACSHSHCGPVTRETYPEDYGPLVDREWLDTVLDRFVQTVTQAAESLQDASVRRFQRV